MPTFESPALYIDFSRLPPPQVVEEIDYEALLKIYQDRSVGLLPTLQKAIKLEQSPTNVILETEAKGEEIVRTRVNAAARAVMLAFATGADLDNLSAFFNQGRHFDVVRLPLVDQPRPFLTNPEDWENDANFRRRIQLAPEAYASAGSEGGYIYHALSADPSIRDASAIRVDDRGLVRVTILNSGPDPRPTKAQIDGARARLNHRKVKPLTDTVYVSGPEVFEIDITAKITLYPGPDQSLVLSEIGKSLNAVRSRTSLLGRDLTRSQIIAALSPEGVQNVSLPSPVADTVCGPTQCTLIRSAGYDLLPYRVE